MHPSFAYPLYNDPSRILNRAHCTVEMTLDQCVQRLRRRIAAEASSLASDNMTALTHGMQAGGTHAGHQANGHGHGNGGKFGRVPSFYTSRSIINLSGRPSHTYMSRCVCVCVCIHLIVHMHMYMYNLWVARSHSHALVLYCVHSLTAGLSISDPAPIRTDSGGLVGGLPGGLPGGLSRSPVYGQGAHGRKAGANGSFNGYVCMYDMYICMHV
jgi:hypothetical protein